MLKWLGSPVRARFAPKTAQDYDRRAESSISNSSPRWSDRRRSPIGFANHHAEAPILILLAPSAASPRTADIPREAGWRSDHSGAEPHPAGGAGGAPRRLWAGPSSWRKWSGDARDRRHRRLAQPRRELSLLARRPLIIAPAAILAETDWLERLASTRIEPAAWGRIPNRIVMLAAASASDAVDELDRDGGARRPGRRRGPARSPVWPASAPVG